MRTGFTLVEILIVVVILGILAMITIPQFSSATAEARASMLADDLRILRTQTQIYKSQHFDVPMGYPNGDPSAAPTEAAFAAQLTQFSTQQGLTSVTRTTGYVYGPYMSQLPENPVNGKSSVKVLANNAPMPTSADDTTGWVYKPSTLEVKANAVGTDENHKEFFAY